MEAKRSQGQRADSSDGGKEECIEDGGCGLEAESSTATVRDYPRDDDVVDCIEASFEALKSQLPDDIFGVIWNSLPVPWAVCSSQGILLKCNAAFINYFKDADVSPLGRSIEEFIAEDEVIPALRYVLLKLAIHF